MPAKIPLEQRGDELELADVLGVDPDRSGTARFIDLTDEEKNIEVVDTEGKVIGFIDLTRNWIRL
jgi:hypothetical protein